MEFGKLFEWLSEANEAILDVLLGSNVNVRTFVLVLRTIVLRTRVCARNIV